MITRIDGLLAGVVSVILGITAHGLAGGFRPDGAQLLLLGAIAVAVAAIRSGQADRDRRRRARGRLGSSWMAISAVLIGSQCASHVALTAVGSHGGHHHDGDALVMLGWHVAALPVAVAALCAVDWMLRVLGSAIVALRTIAAPVPAVPAQLRPVRAVPVLHQLAPRLAVGMRAPPVVG